jgi:hypothetical protein
MKKFLDFVYKYITVTFLEHLMQLHGMLIDNIFGVYFLVSHNQIEPSRVVTMTGNMRFFAGLCFKLLDMYTRAGIGKANRLIGDSKIEDKPPLLNYQSARFPC